MQKLVPTYRHVSWKYYNSECPEGKECEDPKKDSYSFEPLDEQNPKSLYDRLTMEKDKPTLQAITDEFNSWKTLVKAKIVFRNRVKAVHWDDFNVAAEKCGYKVANKAILKKQIIEAQDSVKIECIESKLEEVAQDKLDAKNKEDARKNAIQLLKSTDCLSLGDEFKKNVCLILKR
jgi:hypothetical protein